MSLAMAGLILRIVVLTSAVFFAFLLLCYGFYIVYREYRLVNSFTKLERYLNITKEAGLQADVAKGTLGLTRTTPGLLLIIIGAFILTVCIFQKFDYSGDPALSGTASVPIQVEDSAFQRSVSEALQALDARISALERRTAAPARLDAAFEPEFWDGFEHNRRWKTRQLLFSQARFSRNVAVSAAPTLQDMLSQWLNSARELEGKTLSEQFEYLQRRYGNFSVLHKPILITSPMTLQAIAAEQYGHARFAPLLQVFNPNLPRGNAQVPRYTRVVVYYPQGASLPTASVTLRILGMSREQIYDHVLNIVEGILASPEYRSDPAGWWQQHFPNLGPVEFARTIQSETGREWGVRVVSSEEDESLRDLAKTHFGDRKYAPILQFLNYDSPELAGDPRASLPDGTQITIIHLIEF